RPRPSCRDAHCGHGRIPRARRANHQGSAELPRRMNNSAPETVASGPDAAKGGRRQAAMPFILVVVFIDVLGIGIALPVLPMLVGEYTGSRELQAYWYGALVVA